MRFLALAAFALATVGVAHAADDAAQTAAPAAKVGDFLRDGDARRVAAVTRVYPDGAVQIIYDSHFVVVPANTLSTADGKLKTSLTRKEISKLK